MKFTVNDNEAYLKMGIEKSGDMTFQYGFNIQQPEGGFDAETPEGQAVADAIGIIAGLVFLSQYQPDQLIDIGEMAISEGYFTLDQESGAEMAEFMNELSDEQMELLQTPTKGEA